jgi:hypothetical protein
MSDQLVNALHRAFGDIEYDATDVVCRANQDPQLEAALETLIPNCRYRKGYRRGMFRTSVIRKALIQLNGEGLDVTCNARLQYWSFHNSLIAA